MIDTPPLVPEPVVTVTVFVPVFAGEVQVADVVELTEVATDVPPIEAVMPDRKLVPVRVRVAPPATASPELGDTPVRVGAPMLVKALARVLL